MTYSKLGYFEYHCAITRICFFNRSVGNHYRSLEEKPLDAKCSSYICKIPTAFHTFLYKLYCWSRASSVFILWQPRTRTSRAIFKLWNQVFIRSSQHSEERGVLPRSPSSLLHTWEGFLITHLLHFEIIIVDLFNMKVFRHSVLNLYATSGNLPCFLLVGVTQEIVFVDLTFFITLALYTIKVDFKSNLF